MSAIVKPIAAAEISSPAPTIISDVESPEVCAIRSAIRESNLECCAIITPDQARTRRGHPVTYMFISPKGVIQQTPIPKTFAEAASMVEGLNILRDAFLAYYPIIADDTRANLGMVDGEAIPFITLPYIEMNEHTSGEHRGVVSRWNLDTRRDITNHTIKVYFLPDAQTAKNYAQAYLNGSIGITELDVLADIPSMQNISS